MADGIPRGTTDAEEAAQILRGHEERITRLEEDRDNTRLVQTFRAITDAFALADAVSATTGGDVSVADGFGVDDAVSATTKNAGTGTYNDADEPYNFTTYGERDFAQALFGEAGFGEDGFGE